MKRKYTGKLVILNLPELFEELENSTEKVDEIERQYDIVREALHCHEKELMRKFRLGDCDLPEEERTGGWNKIDKDKEVVRLSNRLRKIEETRLSAQRENNAIEKRISQILDGHNFGKDDLMERFPSLNVETLSWFFAKPSQIKKYPPAKHRKSHKEGVRVAGRRCGRHSECILFVGYEDEISGRTW